MKPADQRLIDRGKGDCLSACVASILEIPTEEVPQFVRIRAEGGDTWFHQLWDFLAPRGLRPASLDVVTYERPWVGRWADKKPRYAIASGKSPRWNGTVCHAVVWEDGKGIVHDPHPSRDGLRCAPEGFIVMVDLATYDAPMAGSFDGDD